jgi:uncharacterized protein (TIGR00369 family)
MPANIPADFRKLAMQPNPFIDPLGPLYGKREDDALVIGLPVEARHCNPGGTCHGGMLMTMADMLLILNANAQSGIHQYMVTINLGCDFVGPAQQGDWIEGRATVLRASKNLIFVNGLISSSDNPVARVNGLFKPTGETRSSFSLESLLSE